MHVCSISPAAFGFAIRDLKACVFNLTRPRVRDPQPVSRYVIGSSNTFVKFSVLFVCVGVRGGGGGGGGSHRE